MADGSSELVAECCCRSSGDSDGQVVLFNGGLAHEQHVDQPSAERYIFAAVKRAIRLLLLIGALIGLFGQTAVYAAGARAPIMSMSAIQMDSDCMEMMKQQPQPAEKPCKGLTPDCIVAMGCIMPVILKESAGSAPAQIIPRAQTFWPTLTVLVGSDFAPETPPPTILG